jgi:hypothetical protein
MTTSALEIIEAATVAEIALVDDVQDVRALPLLELYNATPDPKVEGGYKFEIRTASLPRGYPGATVSVDEDRVELVNDNDTKQYLGSSKVKYRVPIFVAAYARSSGAVTGAARRAAWAIHESILRRLLVFTPTGFSDPDRAFMFKPGPYEPILIDAHTHGILMQFFAEYEIKTYTG